MMDNAVMQSQGNLLSGLDYFQWRWSHVHTAMGDKMKNLINYTTRMNVKYKVNTRLDMLLQDGRWFSREYTHVQLIYQIQIDEIFQYAIFQSDAKPSSIKELTISHLHSYLGMSGYIKEMGAMSAEAMMTAGDKGYDNGIEAMPAKARTAECEKGYACGIGACWPRIGLQHMKKDRRQGARSWASSGSMNKQSSKHMMGCQW
jgi:hypothetical protein